MSDRVKQIASHLNYPKGLLNGEVAIITGKARARRLNTEQANRTCPCTGAAQGIGRSAAIQFAKEGAKVIVSDLDHRESLPLYPYARSLRC